MYRLENLNCCVLTSTFSQSERQSLEAQDGGNFLANLECALSIIL